MELIQIMPADGWYAKYYKLKEEYGYGVNENHVELLARGMVELHTFSKILALGLFDKDGLKFISGIDRCRDSSHEPVNEIMNFIELVYLPDCKKERFTKNVSKDEIKQAIEVYNLFCENEIEKIKYKSKS